MNGEVVIVDGGAGDVGDDESLSEIASRYDTDKSVHTRYTYNYERYFGSLRHEAISLLELESIEAGRCSCGAIILRMA